MPPKSMPGNASVNALTLEAESQQVLDELWTEKLVPFSLNVGKITKEVGEYTIHFYDSRIRTAVIPLTRGHSFRDMVRTAVLARVAHMSGPLAATVPVSSTH
ncbi:MAG: hypothetical protein M3R69_18740 [Acidobacteriota bacterium]|nr:hypothetical protein [Acidobacteriota bacterium]